jgi:Apea-like HEPN
VTSAVADGRIGDPPSLVLAGFAPYQALRQLAERAVQSLNQQYSQSGGIPIEVGWPVWRRDPDGWFRQRPRPSLWSPEAERIIEALPEYARAKTALAEDELSRRHVDQLVGTPFGRTNLQSSGLLWSLIASAVDAEGDLVFRPDLFDGRLEGIVAWFLADTVDWITLVPLSGLTSSVSAPFVLSDSTALDRLDETEIARSLSINVLRPMGSFPMFQNEPELWGVRVVQRVPKIVGAADADHLEQYTRLSSSEVERALIALRVLKPGRFVPLAHLSFTLEPALGESTSFGQVSFDSPHFSSYSLLDDDRSVLEQIASHLVSDGVHRRPYLENAARRFLFAAERTRWDDRLLDLMIAAESLFLGHMSEREGELRFRLAVFAGHLLGRAPEERKMFAQRMRRAYDTRSKIVHGGIPAPETWGSTDTHPTTLADFTLEVESDLRSAIRAALSRAAIAKGKAPFFDWDGAIYGS